MEAIYPVSALQKSQSEVKNAAKKDVVRITENGRGAYIFCSEDVYEHKLKEATNQALYEAQLAMAIERGRQDVTDGRTYTLEEACREIERRVGQ